MGFSHFFVDRPIFASVLSIILTLVGAISFRALPVTEFPEIAPPTVEVTATFAGAAADVVSDTVASPIEQEINGVDDMIYMESQSTGDGAMKISVVFKPGTNIDQAQVLVQNRVSIAIPRLPEEVQRIGVTVKKKSPDLMMVIHLISPDGSLDQAYISNYATINIKDVLTRIDGVGDTIVFGARDYSMRVWLDPAKTAVPRPDGGRCGHGAARRQRAGCRRRHQPAAGEIAGRLPGRGADARPADQPRAVQRHHRRQRSGWPGDAGARHRAASSSAPIPTSAMPISTARSRRPSASSSGRARMRSRPRS